MSDYVKLRDVVKIIGGGTPSKSEKNFYENGTIKWATVGDMNTELIVDTELKITEKAIANSSTNIITSDAIVIATRVGLGKVCYLESETAINQDLKGLLPNNDRLIKEYLYYFFKSISQYIIENGTGATVKGVKLDFINNIDIPLPPLAEQQRIVSKLDLLFEKIDKSIALHQKNMDEADLFMGSVLNDIFGELEEKYTKVPLFEVADVSRGKSKHRPRNDKRLFGGNYPFIQTGDVRNADKYITTYTNTYSEFGLAQSKLWKKGTICMTIAANIGDVAILDMDSCFPDSVVGLYSENNSNDYLYFFLQTLKQHLESKATTTAQMNINLKVLQTIGVPLPPLSVQENTVKYLNDIYEKIEKIKSVQKEKMDSLKALKASILDQAFRGEL